MNKLMSSAVASSRIGEFDTIASHRFDDFDLTPMMVNLIDTVAASALPWLAKQFDVDSFKGYDLCQTTSQKRELIKSAIDLHRHVGTISTIRKACSLIGYTPTAIEENVPLSGETENTWCAFRIRLSPSDLGSFNTDSLTKLRTYIEYYKNARSILAGIGFDIHMSDKIFSKPAEERDSLTLTSNLTGGDFSLDFSYDFN